VSRSNATATTGSTTVRSSSISSSVTTTDTPITTAQIESDALLLKSPSAAAWPPMAPWRLFALTNPSRWSVRSSPSATLRGSSEAYLEMTVIIAASPPLLRSTRNDAWLRCAGGAPWTAANTK
jgi:hypothetical protein